MDQVYDSNEDEHNQKGNSGNWTFLGAVRQGWWADERNYGEDEHTDAHDNSEDDVDDLKRWKGQSSKLFKHHNENEGAVESRLPCSISINEQHYEYACENSNNNIHNWHGVHWLVVHFEKLVESSVLGGVGYNVHLNFKQH